MLSNAFLWMVWAVHDLIIDVLISVGVSCIAEHLNFKIKRYCKEQNMQLKHKILTC